jgi:glutamyl-Q tRNA(Asp) synthetase
LLNADFANRFGGRFLLRIEDIDLTRCRPEFEAGIYEDLGWLGLGWEEPVRRQSEHFADYRAAFLRLKGKGVVYPCFCSRKEISDAVACREAESGQPWPRDPDGAAFYPGTCKALTTAEVEHLIAEGRPCGWRIDRAAARIVSPGPHGFTRFDEVGREENVPADPWRWGDTIIVRKDVPTSYHLSVVTDDALQAVTHVVRGKDLEAATDLHVLLQSLLDLETPLYHHHDLLLDLTGGKLSKSRRSQSLAELREQRLEAADVRRHLGFSPQPIPST